VRIKIFGTAQKPRLCVFRSHQHIYAQLINDETKKTILAVNSQAIKKGKKTKVEIAREVGRMIAEKAKNLPAGRQVEKVIFDRGPYKYHGRVKALAEGAREAGLKF